MLRKLTIENYLSIGPAQTLDLSIARNAPDPDKRFAEPIPNTGERFPRTVVIFGGNASGKTNVLKSISFLAYFVRLSVDQNPESIIPILSFNSDEFFTKNTSFRVEFDAWVFPESGGREKYLYELEISPDAKSVVVENLKNFPSGWPRRLFERNGQDIAFAKEFGISNEDPIRERIRPNASVISTLAKFNHPIATAFYNNLAAVRADVFSSGKIATIEENATRYYERNSEAVESLTALIQKFDLGIEKITFEKDKDGIRPRFIHKGHTNSLGYQFESQGTQNFYKLFPEIFFVLRSGGVAVLDELGSDIHPLILPEILHLFQKPESNPLGAQLIMSCHNATLLEHLAKEEVYFTEKDEHGRTVIYGLKDIEKVRRDTNIYAKYLSGVFGGIPKIG